jgi:hypothetical protein
MKFRDFRQYFSASRVNRYLLATGNSTTKAVRLYKANLYKFLAHYQLDMGVKT